jgi:hypothetical protein
MGQQTANHLGEPLSVEIQARLKPRLMIPIRRPIRRVGRKNTKKNERNAGKKATIISPSATGDNGLSIVSANMGINKFVMTLFAT